MKIRSGFVSNSSSSSFMVAFPRRPKSVQDVKDMVFKNESTFSCYFYDDEEWDAHEVSEIIFKDIKNQIPNNKNRFYGRMHSILVDDINNFCSIPAGYDYEVINSEAWDLANRKEVDVFFKENAGSFIYFFSYSDGDGRLMSAMEHGDLFKNLPHKISNNH